MDEKYFKRDRYNKEVILEAFEKIETINKIFDLDISSDNSVEIHLDEEEMSIDLIKEIISEIPAFDNYVQDFCELIAERSSYGTRNYMVALAWMKIEQNKVLMGYWGEYVNIELRAIFVKNNSV
jgi:hypothetical protein